MRSILGIYFGIKTISIVETKNKNIINNITIPREIVLEGELEEKVPEEIKLVALIKNELRNVGIETKDTAITIPGNDLIIRSFEMNLLPREELLTAVNFEAKKYIPFKTEDLISVFQVKSDRENKKNQVLFFSIRKEILDRYVSVIEQVGLNIINNNIEYSAFSLVRLLDLTGKKKRGILGIMAIDAKEEINFVVLDNGFPLFSRDINLATGIETQFPMTGTTTDLSFFGRLKNEIRISLDYYRRKFPAKQMNRLIVVANEADKNNIAALCDELGLHSEFINIVKYAGSQTQLDISSIKAYGASLANSVRLPLRLNLLSAREKASKVKESETELGLPPPSLPIRVDYRFILTGIAIVFLSFIFGFYQRSPLENAIKVILNNRVRLSSLTSQETYEELNAIYSEYNNKLNILDNLVKNQIYLTEELNIIPSILPEGAWLTELSFKQDKTAVELTLNGRVFLKERNKEFEAVNGIHSNLKNNPSFSKTFKDISITSLNRTKVQDYEVTDFVILCKTKKYGT